MDLSHFNGITPDTAVGGVGTAAPPKRRMPRVLKALVTLFVTTPLPAPGLGLLFAAAIVVAWRLLR